MVHLPCIKTKSLLKIYRYLPFPTPTPFKSRAHDFTIKKSLNFQDYLITKSNYQDLFDQDHLDYPQFQKELIITDTSNLITINNRLNFQVLAQTDLANCVPRNHMYLYNKQHVLHYDLTNTCP